MSKKQSDSPVRLRTEIRGSELAPHYKVIVECWKHKNQGRVKRAWLKEFTEQERDAAARLHNKGYHYYFVTGFPQRATMELGTYYLLRRLATFFVENY